jgi:hypothetical protein
MATIPDLTEPVESEPVNDEVGVLMIGWDRGVECRETDLSAEPSGKGAEEEPFS